MTGTVPAGLPIPWFGRDDVERLLDLETVIESQRQAFVALDDGTGQLAERLLLRDPTDGSTAFCYAARVSSSTGPVCKFGSVNPANAAAGIATVSATVLVLDPTTGRPIALMDGEPVTTARTSAASALAARHLAAPGASTLAVIGSGVQAAAHVAALTHVLPVEQVRMHGRSPEKVAALTDRLTTDLGVPVIAADSPEEAVEGAAVVVTATTSTRPVLDARSLAAGALVISVGSFSPDRVELGGDVLRRADVVVADHVPTAIAQCGSLVDAVRHGDLDPGSVSGLGAVLTGRSPGRRRPEDVVVYASVGLGIQDAAVAWALLFRT